MALFHLFPLPSLPCPTDSGLHINPFSFLSSKILFFLSVALSSFSLCSPFRTLSQMLTSTACFFNVMCHIVKVTYSKSLFFSISFLSNRHVLKGTRENGRNCPRILMLLYSACDNHKLKCVSSKGHSAYGLVATYRIVSR